MELSDRELLERFAASADQSAFAEFVRRHGRLVMGVCRRVLRDTHHADDAFQATFLVLAQKAASLGAVRSLSGWVYGVAFRVAMKAKGQMIVRRAHERKASAMARPDPSPESSWEQLRPILDEELDRLPEKYRMPVVLCYLEGKTNEAAVEEIGWPKGTMLTRLARARELLRERLVRRGAVVTGALLGTLLLEKAGSAAISTALAASTVKIASLVAAGNAAAPGLMSAQVGLLFKGGLKALLVAKMKIASAIVIAVGLGSTAAGVAVYHAIAPEPSAPVEEKIPEALLRKAALLRPEPGAYKWRQIPWTLDVAAALRSAREEKRPLLAWVSADDPLERC